MTRSQRRLTVERLLKGDGDADFGASVFDLHNACQTICSLRPRREHRRQQHPHDLRRRWRSARPHMAGFTKPLELRIPQPNLPRCQVTLIYGLTATAPRRQRLIRVAPGNGVQEGGNESGWLEQITTSGSRRAAPPRRPGPPSRRAGLRNLPPVPASLDQSSFAAPVRDPRTPARAARSTWGSEFFGLGPRWPAAAPIKRTRHETAK